MDGGCGCGSWMWMWVWMRMRMVDVDVDVEERREGGWGGGVYIGPEASEGGPSEVLPYCIPSVTDL